MDDQDDTGRASGFRMGSGTHSRQASWRARDATLFRPGWREAGGSLYRVCSVVQWWPSIQDDAAEIVWLARACLGIAPLCACRTPCLHIAEAIRPLSGPS